jgi:hypothetical protein
MQNNFRLQDGYVALCEQSPDEGRTRIDLIVFQLSPETQTLTKLCMVEGKRWGAGGPAPLVEAERQALDGAMKSFEHNSSLHVVYAMTFWRTQFRLWAVHPSEKHLATVGQGVRLGR